METLLICLIFAALCLAASALMVHNAANKVYADIKKEENSRKSAFRESFDVFFGTQSQWEKEMEELNAQNVELQNKISVLEDKVFDKETEIADLKSRVSDLENGIIPDFEQAKEAVRSVNDFNKGISAIMGYDPFEARRKAQEERGDNR